MKNKLTVFLFFPGCLLFIFYLSSFHAGHTRTVVSIHKDQFYINGQLTYKNRNWEGNKIEGLLFNSRMVQGIFDDSNPKTRGNFNYPDTNIWDPKRNTDEFVAAMADWKSHGLLAFSLNLQGGSPLGYGNHGWINSAFESDGTLNPDYLSRLEKIVKRADELKVAVILGYFYFGQDQHLKDEQAVVNAVDHITKWILKRAYRNVLIEINNECNVSYHHEILKPGRVSELIKRVQDMSDHKLLVSASFGGNTVPSNKVIEVADFILLHGNGIGNPDDIKGLIEKVRHSEAYTVKPILFNEDDHYDFDKETYNLKSSIESYTSWGYFDYRQKGEGYESGFQSVPVDWAISSKRKKSFFNKLKEITGY